ncbi:membrane-bound PQQ-dependent dehydrogenase, glucose/quinate/shikimate family [Afifella sp. IM 167]|nr:membrane-bound PQQ-dependent dehydrogenase, glucose/quinate/shikimate family [Afifella sp. IM 167]
MLPFVTRPLVRYGETKPAPWRGAGIPLAVSLVFAFCVAAYALWTPSNDIAGSLPTERVANAAEGPAGEGPDVPDEDWPAYGRTEYGQTYSPLAEINSDNVNQLEVAWEYHTGDTKREGDPNETTYEVTPLKIGDTIYLCTPHNLAIALDAKTGEEKWRFDPKVGEDISRQHQTCRGVSYYQVPEEVASAASVTGGENGEGTGTAVSESTSAESAAPSDAGQAESTESAAQSAPSTAQTPDASAESEVMAESGTAQEAELPAAESAIPSAPSPVGEPNLAQGGETPPAADQAAPATSVPAEPELSESERKAAAMQEECPRRIYLPTADARLIALNAETGIVCESFANGGHVDLWKNMPYTQQGFYYSTSAPTIARGVIIVGGSVNDNVSTTEPSGVIRGYDVDTGDLLWNWDSGDPDETTPIPDDETYTANSPNSWTTMSADPDFGLVYVPLGNAPPDQFGGNRTPETERFSSSIVALDIATGKLRWVFQTVHHDLWDMDVPSQPALIDLNIDGETVPAIVQATKQADIYVLNRETGEPILPVTEEPAPQGAAQGDTVSETQPTSALSFKPPLLEERDMWGATMFDQLVCRIRFKQYRWEGRFTPPSVNGSLVHPGNFGAFNWGGIAVDPERGIMFGTPSYLAFISRLIPRENDEKNYVSDGKPGLNENYGAPYAAVLKPFTSPVGLPCQAPPWGYVAGADLTTGEIAYMHQNGTVRDRAPVPVPFNMGVPDLGGPVLTGGNLAFISGTLDYYVRAFDATTGRKLWQSRLPAGGQATPMTYAVDGKQYLLVVAGGHGSLGTKTGDSIIAYALPDS